MAGRLKLVWARPALTVTVIASVLALVVTWPLILHLRSFIYGYPGDAIGTVSDFWWFDYALGHGKPLLYNELRGSPLGSGWETVYFDVAQVGVFAPLSYLIGPIAAYNLGVLSSFPLTAFVTFALGRRLGLTNLAAAFASLAFTFVPYHQEKAMVHLMHTHMELFAAFLYFGVRWRQTASRWSVLGAGLIAGGTLWVDPTMAYLMAVVVIVFFATSFVMRPAGWTWKAHLTSHVVAAVSVAVVAALFLPAVLAVSERGGAQPNGSLQGQFVATSRMVTELDTYSARLKEYVQPWHLNPLVPVSVRKSEKANLHGSGFAEQTLTIGYTVIALGAIGLVANRRTYGVIVSAVLVAAGFIMTQPPERHILGFTITAPSHYLFTLLPIFRVYSRFAMLVLLGAALLAGFGFMALQARLRGGRTWLLAIPFLLVAVEFNGLPPSHTYQILPAPAEYTWLKGQPPGILIEYPIAIKSSDPAVGTAIEVQNRVYTLYQQVHVHPLFNGATPDSAAGKLAYSLEPYYAPGVSAQLQSLSIRYVFVHRTAYANFGRDPNQTLTGYRFVQRLGDTDIYELETAA